MRGEVAGQARTLAEEARSQEAVANSRRTALGALGPGSSDSV